MSSIAAVETAVVSDPNNESESEVTFHVNGVEICSTFVPVNPHAGRSWRVLAVASAKAKLLTGDAHPKPGDRPETPANQQTLQANAVPAGAPRLGQSAEAQSVPTDGHPDYDALSEEALITIIRAYGDERSDALNRFMAAGSVPKSEMVAIARNEPVDMNVLAAANGVAIDEEDDPDLTPIDDDGDGQADGPDGDDQGDDVGLPIGGGTAEPDPAPGAGAAYDGKTPTESMMKRGSRTELEQYITEQGLAVNTEDYANKNMLADAVLAARAALQT